MKRTLFTTAAMSLLLAVSIPSHSFAATDSEQQTEKPNIKLLIGAPYNEELYELSYRVFLDNNNIKDAYILSQSALEHNPKSILWRKRLAELSMWNEQPKIALQQWIYIATYSEGGDKQLAIDKIIELAPKLNDNRALLIALSEKLIQDPNDEKAWNQLAAAYEKLGEPQEAIKLLKTGYKQNKQAYMLALQASLYQSMGKPTQELAVLDQLVKSHGTNPQIALRQAQIYYKRGDMQQALDSMHAAKNQAEDSDVTFWRTYDDISWILEDSQDSLTAINKLYSSGDAEVDDYIRMVDILRQRNPERAFKVAREGWDIFKNDTLFDDFLSIGTSMQRWPEMIDEANALTPAQRKRVGSNASYWQYMARAYDGMGMYDKAEQAYINAIAVDPNNYSAKASLIWFYIVRQDGRKTAEAMQRWANIMSDSPTLQDAYAGGFILLDEKAKALQLFEQTIDRHQNDYEWLLIYADLLDTAKRHQQAENVRFYVWAHLKEQFIHDPSSLSEPNMRAYSLLSHRLEKGDATYLAMSHLANTYSDMSSADILVGWAVDNNFSDVANELTGFYNVNNIDVPGWTEANVLAENVELEEMNQFNQKQGPATAEVDQAAAITQLLGYKHLAQYHAYNTTDLYPQDNQFYDNMTDIALEAADHISVREQFMQEGALEGFQTQIAGKFWLMHNVAIEPYVNVMPQYSTDPTQLVNIPSVDREAGVKLDYYTRRTDYQVGVGERASLHHFTTAIFNAYTQWTSNLRSLVRLGYNQRADDTSALEVAGVKDMALLNLSYDISDRDTIQGQFEADAFTDQAHNYLGSGQIYSGQIDHTLRFEYPDIILRAFGKVSQYQASGTPKGKTLTVIPVGTTPNANFFIPNSFNEWGIGGSIGESVREVYTEAWRPYLSYDVFYNSETTYGYDTNVGITGSVLGRDKLSFYFDQNYGGTGVSQFQSVAGVQYKYFY